MPTLVLLRHGQSEWNKLNLFTGWHDVDLTEQGEEEARSAGRLLVEEQLEVDIVHTSLQRRAIRTANLALEVADRLWIPTHRHWRLNERHYGALLTSRSPAASDRGGPVRSPRCRCRTCPSTASSSSPS